MQSLIRFNVTQDGFSPPATSISSPSHDASVVLLWYRSNIKSESMEESCHIVSYRVMLRLQLLDVFGYKSVSWELVQGFGASS